MDLNPNQIKEKLYLLLKHASETTAYYTELLPVLDNIDIDYIFRKLPILTRQDIQLHRNRLISSKGDSRNWCVMRTSGTTGEPLDFIRDAEFQIKEAEILSEHFDRCLGNKKWRNKNLIHASLNLNLQTRSISSIWNPNKSKLIKWNLTRVLRSTDEEFIKSLKYFNNNIITMFPSAAEIIAKRISDTKQVGQVKPCLVLLSGEIVDKSLKCLLRNIFSCPVTEIYTMTEVPIIASECLTDGGYHIETQSVILEIVDGNGIPRSQNDSDEGDVIVTSLENRAMPLIRYRTEDRASWINSKCQCGRESPRIEIRNARQSKSLINSQNENVDILSFVKPLRNLDIDQYKFEQIKDHYITLFYKAREAISLDSHDKISASLKLALGLSTEVKIERASSIKSEANVFNDSKKVNAISLGYDIHSVASWLRKKLAPYKWINVALLTGSALASNKTTKFSDIDLTIITENNSYLLPWLQLTAHLKSTIPNINCMCNERQNFEINFPLLTCRLIKEQIIIKGNLTLEWPNINDIYFEAKYWLRNTITIIAHRLANTDFASQNPIQEAWIAMKYTLDALRYHYVLHKLNETTAQKIEELFVNDAIFPKSLRKDVVILFQVAREQIPPPTQISGNASIFHFSALLCVQHIMRIIEDKGSQVFSEI